MKRISLAFIIIYLVSGCQTIQVGGFSAPIGLLTKTAKAAGKASRPISDEEEYYVGRAVTTKLLSSYSLLKDEGLTEYINYIGQTIVLHSDKPFTHGGYHFAVLDSDEINAFACPGGTIFITKGMMDSVENEDELAAVLAHEIAHVSHRDGISSIKKSRWTEAVTVIGSEAAKEYGAGELSQLVSIFEGSIDDVFKTLVVNGYGKSQEYSADTKALSYLAKAGYNPDALKIFLDRLFEQGKSSGGGVLETHPATTERIDNVKDNLPTDQVDPSLVEKRTNRFHSII